MDKQNYLADTVAITLIRSDLLMFRDLAVRHIPESVRSIAILALMPFLSMFMHESAVYLERMGVLRVQDLKPHEEMLRTSRLRIKLLDDDQKSMAEVLDNASVLAAINNRWFQELHHGPLAPLKRWIQPELGIFFVSDEIICSTHVAFLNLGLSKEALSASSLTLETLGPFLQETAVDFGEYMGLLLHALGTEANAFNDLESNLTPQIQFRDLKANRFYESMARRVAPQNIPVCILLTSILSYLNTARLVVPLIAGHNTISAFKVGFISVFHAASSLQKLLNQESKEHFLHPVTTTQIKELLRHKSIRSLRKYRSLRHNLVHYGVDDHIATHLTSDNVLFGIVEAHTSGLSFSVIANEVDSSLNLMSAVLRDLLVPELKPQGTL